MDDQGSGNTPDQPQTEEREKTRRRALIELAVVVAILFFIFVVFLPQFIDYGQVIDSIQQLTVWQFLALFVAGMLRIWFEAGIYNVLIPGLRWWPGFKAWLASNSVAFIAPPGADLAIRFGMYRSVGIKGESAGASIILSWFFTTGIKLVLPVVALVIVVADGNTDDVVINITLIAVIVLLAGIGFISLILYREALASKLGEVMQRWYNNLFAGRWRFKEAGGLAERMVGFREQIVGTLRERWLPASVVTFVSQAIFFLMLVMSLRFVGVGADEAPLDIIFLAYAIGLLFSLIPILPAGLGVVEVVYVGIIAGESNTELANAVMAAAFVHRIFTWLVPILIGLVPLSTWRKQMRAMEADQASEAAGAH